MASLKVWAMASRPKTLPLIISPVVVGSSMAVHEGSFDLAVFIMTLCTGLLVQILTNFANDYFDFKKGADTKDRIGPTRVMQKGLLSQEAMKKGMAVCSIAILLGGVYLVNVGGWPIGVLTLIALFLSYGYTSGPFPLAYLGLGDLFVIGFFGVVATSCTFFLQAGFISPSSLFIGLLLGFLCNAPLMINNLRDEEQDRKVAKKTIVVRLGQEKGKLLLLLCTLLPAAGTPFIALMYSNPWFILAALPVLYFFPYHIAECQHPHDFLPLLPRFSLIITAYSLVFSFVLLFLT